MNSATKVGALVVFFVALLFLAWTALGRQLIAEKTKTYFAEFQDAGGIAPGAKVLMAGVKIGTVGKVGLKTAKVARLTLIIDDAYEVPQGSTAVIPASFIGLGDTPVQILPPDVSSGPLAANSTIPGMRPSAIDSLLPEGRDAVKELTAMLKSTRKLIEDGELKKNLNGLLTSSQATLTKFGALADQTQGLLARNRGQIDQAIHSLSAAMGDVQASTAMMARLLKERKFEKSTLALLDNLNTTSQRASTLVGDLDKFVNDPKLREPLNGTVANFEKITASGTRIADNTETMTANFATVSAKAIEIANKASMLEDDAHELLKKFGGLLKGGGAKAPQVHYSMDLTREQKPNHWRTDLNGWAPVGQENLHLGLYDAFESNKINAQLGKNFAGTKGEYRYGVYASKPGVGVDYALTPRLGFRTDLFDINDPRLDVRASYEFRPSVIGWIGLEKLFRRDALTLGVGVRK